MTDQIETDIVVAGNGPVGMIAALALAEFGLKIAIIGPKQVKYDHRTTTLMMPSIKLLDKIGVWDAVKPQAAALKSMRILDGTDRLIRSRPVTFQASEIQEDAFGWNMPNMVLNGKLLDAVSSNRLISSYEMSVTAYEFDGRRAHEERTSAARDEYAARTRSAQDGYAKRSDQIRVSTSAGLAFQTRLVVGADGRNSLAREAANIKCTTWSYPQSALVTTFEHKRPHENCSTEFHTETGPFTVVPLPQNRSSLVWVLKPKVAAELANLDAEGLSRQIETRMQSMLGKVSVSADRQVYPLSGQYPSRFAKDRIALAGEAAHLFPPIGAQGLNLGIRDVEDLCAAIADDLAGLGSPAQMSAYDARRRPDIMARTGAVDALNRSLLTSFLPTQLVRSLGLATLDVVPPLRSFFMREGMRPGSGFTALVTGLKKSARG